LRFTEIVNLRGGSKRGGHRVDACALIRKRLAELGLDQKALAAAAGVTESYVSQLLRRKKPPPSPNRTDIYGKMEERLGLPRGKLSELAEHQRIEELRRHLGNVPQPLNRGVRDFVLRKCLPSREPQIRAEFEKDAFGPLESLVTQKLLDVKASTCWPESAASALKRRESPSSSSWTRMSSTCRLNTAIRSWIR
jgi:transcriptional regulator with XRE-family HTH domain